MERNGAHGEEGGGGAHLVHLLEAECDLPETLHELLQPLSTELLVLTDRSTSRSLTTPMSYVNFSCSSSGLRSTFSFRLTFNVFRLDFRFVGKRSISDPSYRACTYHLLRLSLRFKFMFKLTFKIHQHPCLRFPHWMRCGWGWRHTPSLKHTKHV